MASDGSVQIRISGSVDASLQSSVRETKAQLDSLSSATRVSAADIKAALGGNISGAAALRSALDGTAAAQFEVGAAAAAASRVGVEGMAAAERATKGLDFATSGATQEYVRLAHEAMTGNFSRMPGSVVVLASRMGGLGAVLESVGVATLALGAAGVVAAGGMAFLGYQALRERKELDDLTESFKMSGQAAEFSRGFIQYELNAMSQLPGVTRSAAKEFLELASANTRVSAVLENQVHQLMPAFVDHYGKRAPQAAAQLMNALSDLTLDGFQRLDGEMLGLNPAEFEQIENLIRIGNTAEATSRILAALSQNAGIYIKSLGDQVYDIDQKMKALQTSTSSIQAFGAIKALQKELDAVREKEAAAGNHEADTKYKDDLAAAIKINDSLHERQGILLQIKRLEQDEAQAQLRQDKPGTATFSQALTDEKKKLSDLDKRSAEESYNLFVEKEDAKGAAYSAHSAQRIAIMRTELAAAKAAFGAESKQYYEKQKEINDATREASEKSGRAEVNAARRTADEVADIKRQAALRHIEAEASTNSFLLGMGAESLEQWRDQAIKLENDRYQAEKDGIEKRKAADQSNKVALAKDQAEEDALYQAHADRLTGIDEEYQQKKRQAQQIDLQEFIRSQQARLQEAISTLNSEEQAHQISARTRHDLEVQLTQQIRAEVLRRFDAENAALVKGTVAYQKYAKDRAALEASFTKGVVAADNKLVTDEAQKWHTLADSIEGSFNGALDQLIFHGGTLQQFMSSVAIGIGEAFLQMGEQMIETWILQEIFGKTASMTSATSQINAAAGVGFANAYAATSAIPIIGPEIAPEVAAATAMSIISGGMSIAAFEVGTNMVPADMVALLHAGERVIPAADNRFLMEAVGSNMNGSTSNGRGSDIARGSGRPVNFEPHFHINAVDGASVARMVNSGDFRRGFTRMAKSAISQGQFKGVVRRGSHLG